jgi:hypothetical protein
MRGILRVLFFCKRCSHVKHKESVCSLFGQERDRGKEKRAAIFILERNPCCREEKQRRRKKRKELLQFLFATEGRKRERRVILSYFWVLANWEMECFQRPHFGFSAERNRERKERRIKKEGEEELREWRGGVVFNI